MEKFVITTEDGKKIEGYKENEYPLKLTPEMKKNGWVEKDGFFYGPWVPITETPLIGVSTVPIISKNIKTVSNKEIIYSFGGVEIEDKFVEFK